MSTTVGIRVKARRKEMGLTQTQLGTLCGLSQQTIQNIESGRNRSSGNLVALAEALKVRPEWLAEGKGPMQDSSPPAARAVIREIEQRTLTQQLGDGELALILDLVKRISSPTHPPGV